MCIFIFEFSSRGPVSTANNEAHLITKPIGLRKNTYYSGLLEVCVCTVAGLDEAIATVEDRDHQHAKGEHVTCSATLGFVLDFRS